MMWCMAPSHDFSVTVGVVRRCLYARHCTQSSTAMADWDFARVLVATSHSTTQHTPPQATTRSTVNASKHSQRPRTCAGLCSASFMAGCTAGCHVDRFGRSADPASNCCRRMYDCHARMPLHDALHHLHEEPRLHSGTAGLVVNAVAVDRGRLANAPSPAAICVDDAAGLCCQRVECVAVGC